MNWEEFKEELKQDSPLSREIVERAEKDARQVSGLIDRREELGLSDRDITKLCRARSVSVEADRLKKRLQRRSAFSRLLARLGQRPRPAAK